MATNEQLRALESLFIDQVQRIMHYSRNPIKAHNFIEAVGNLAGCNIMTLNTITNTVMSYDSQYIPSKYEKLCLAMKQNIPVREMCKQIGISQTTYYKYVDISKEIYIQPKFTVAQHEQMQLFLDCIDSMHIPTEKRIII